MATRIATADGLFSAAATWGVVETTSLLDDETGTFAVATAATWSQGQNFTPGVVTIDGLAVKIATRAASPSGTMSVRIYNVTGAAAVAGTTVTINVSDILSTTLLHNGWMFFKFAAPVALAAATNYRVEAQTSSATQVNLYRNSTGSNMARMLRTTTTGAPAAGDNLFVLGEWTAAATKTNRSVTMDSTAATDYGGASTTLASFGISNGGTLTYGSTAATNYVLRVSGLVDIWIGGTLNMGTVATPIPRDSTAVLELDCAADDDFAVRCWGTWISQGLSRTSGKNVVGCLLSADEAIAQTVLSVNTDTGWLNGDDIAIASTTRTQTQTEARTLSGAATATEVTVSLGLTNAHSGTSPYQAEVILLTRNVRVRAVNSSFMMGVKIGPTGTTDWDWTDFQYIGANSGTKGQGVEFESTAAQTIEYCGFREAEDNGVWNDSVTVTLNHCTFYRCANVTGYQIYTVGGTTTIANCWIVGNSASAQDACATQGVSTIPISNTRFAGCGYGVYSISETTYSLTDVVIHCCATALYLGQVKSAVCTNVDLIRCSANGLDLRNGGGEHVFTNVRVIGNATQGVVISNSRVNLSFLNCTFAGDSSFAQPYGINLVTGNAFYRIVFKNCTFGVVAGTFVAHSLADFDASSGPQVHDLTFINCALASATEFSAAFLGSSVQTLMSRSSVLRFQRKEGTTQNHYIQYISLGTVTYETTTFRTASPSEKLTPGAALSNPTPAVRLRSSVKRIAVASGQSATISVYVRKDGSYGGSAPRLVLLANPALGIDNDTVLDTMTGGSGSWEQLTGTSSPVAEEDGVLECYVDCDGSAGNVFVDDWSASVA